MVQSLADQIERFEALLAEMREATRDGHAVLRDIREAKKDISDILSATKAEMHNMVDAKVEEMLKHELDRIHPSLKRNVDSIYATVDRNAKQHAEKIYRTVQKQCDMIINLAFGTPIKADRQIGGQKVKSRQDIADKLREWLRETMHEEIDRLELEIKEFPDRHPQLTKAMKLVEAEEKEEDAIPKEE